MKKFIALSIALVMSFSIAACTSSTDKTEKKPDENAEEVVEVPSELTVNAGDDQIYTDLTFDKDLTIYLDTEADMDSRSQILFGGCTFNGDINVIGDKSAFVRFTEGCVFGENCEINVMGATEGVAENMTSEDDLVKLLFTDTGAVINADTICNVI